MYAAIIFMFYLHLYWHFHCILIHIFIYFHLYLYCLVSFPNPLAHGSDIQIHVSWGTRLVLLCLKRSVSCRKVAQGLQRSPTHLIMIHVCRNCIYILLVFVWVFPLYINTHFHSFSFVFVLFCLKRSVTCWKVALALQRILSPFDTL